MELSNVDTWLAAPRDVVTVAGADALTYLQGQVSQELRDLALGQTRWTFLLDPTGKIDALARIERSGDEVFTLDTDAGHGVELLARINRFKIRVKVDTALEAASTDEIPPAAEAGRIEAGWPRLGVEIEPGKTIPGETGLTEVAVNYAKGCYPGQELVERMDSRGAEAPRSLRRLTVEAGAVAGDEITDNDGNVVGVMTSVSSTTALGYVKRGSDVGERVTFSYDSE